LCIHPGEGCKAGEGKCYRGPICEIGVNVCREIPNGCQRMDYFCEPTVSGGCCKYLTCDKFKSRCMIDKKADKARKEAEKNKKIEKTTPPKEPKALATSSAPEDDKETEQA
jgi:hypothetical protein